MTVQQLEYVRRFLDADDTQMKELTLIPTLTLTGLDDDGLGKVMQLIKKSNLDDLTSLSFTDGKITNAGLKYFEQLPQKIKSVDLSENTLTEGAGLIITELFKAVDYINLSSNQLTDFDIKHLSIHAIQLRLLVSHNKDTNKELVFQLDKKLYQNRVMREQENRDNAIQLSESTPFWAFPPELIEEIYTAMEEQSSCTARHGIKFDGPLNFISADFKPN